MTSVFLALASEFDRKQWSSVLSRQPGFEVRDFEDGLEAYRCAQQAPPRLMLLEEPLLGMSGLAIARLLRFHQDYRQVKILFLAGAGEEDLQAMARENGVDILLTPPLDKEMLLEAVSRLLADPPEPETTK